jgi:hypothetical protein
VAVKLYRCSNEWVKIKAHPCWKVEKALMDMGIDYERVPGPVRKSKRELLDKMSGQRLYPVIEFEDSSVYREESKDMEKTIREGRLMEKSRGTATAPASG